MRSTDLGCCESALAIPTVAPRKITSTASQPALGGIKCAIWRNPLLQAVSFSYRGNFVDPDFGRVAQLVRAQP